MVPKSSRRVTLAWALVVGLTGFIDELSSPLFGLYMRTDVAAMLRPWQQQKLPGEKELSSLQFALQTAHRATPGMAITSVVYPGSPFGSPHHYVVWAKGATPLMSRLFNPVLVDARSGSRLRTLPVDVEAKVTDPRAPRRARSDRGIEHIMKVWTWPLAFAGLSLFGLLSALLGQGGLWWGLSWIGLGTPLVALSWLILRRK
jgi:hypothetical protein